eukprot:gene6955-9511_t
MEENTLTISEDVIEQDTTDVEDIPSIYQFIMSNLPSKQTIEDLSLLGMVYNKRIFQGWVRQPSACCGAASIAGAWNSLYGLHRADRNAINHIVVLDIFKDIFRNLIEKKKKSFERKLGAMIDTFLEEVAHKIIFYGREIGGKKGFGATKKVVLLAIKSIVKNHNNLKLQQIENSNKQNTDNFQIDQPEEQTLNNSDRNAITCFAEILSYEQQIKLSKKDSKDEKEYDSGDDNDEDSEDDSGVEDDSSINEVIIISTSKKNKKISENSVSNKEILVSGWPTWKKEFMEIIKNMGGLAKLNQHRPSTASIGNWGILDGVKLLAEYKDVGSEIIARLFMGKKKTLKSKIDVSLSRNDSQDTIKNQWNCLRSSFYDQSEVLIFHLKNHYALIFALREWYDDENGQYFRQLLTARKGQRPTAWIDFSEARDIMLGWEGYKIIAIKRKDVDSTNKSKK